MEDHTDAYDSGEHEQYFQEDSDPNGPPPNGEDGEREGPRAPPFRGGNDEASLWLAAVVLGIVAGIMWIPPFWRMVTAPRRWWASQDVKNEWFTKWSAMKLVPLVLFLFCVFSLLQYVEEDHDVVAYRHLGLTPEATTNEVKKAWRKLAKVSHPDAMKAPTESDRRRFEMMQAAYTAIMNPDESKEERLREKMWKDQMTSGESVALPAFMLKKENKKWVMLAAISGILVPLAYCLYLVNTGALEDSKDSNSGVPNRRNKNKKEKKQ